MALIPKASIEGDESPGSGDGFTVWTDWTDTEQVLDRPRSFGISTRTLALAKRLARAIDAGAVFTDVEVKVDVNGKTYVGCNSRVMAKRANADLKRLGY